MGDVSVHAGGTLSVVTPTLRRVDEVRGLLECLAAQTRPPDEVIIVDGAPTAERGAEEVAHSAAARPFRCRYIRHGGGTAIQRNVGLAAAGGQFVAFIDDDIRPEPEFFKLILQVFDEDRECRVGGITGNITNEFLDPSASPRWRWYRRLRLFTTYEPGRYDFKTGYPINRYLQPPHEGLREVDFFGTACGVWRREVFQSGLRFSEFFADYGVLEDAHLALRAGRSWRLLECGRARCTHLRSPKSRANKRRLAWKSAVNYRYVFVDLVPTRTWQQEFRFWLVQLFDLARQLAYAIRAGAVDDWLAVVGKTEGIVAALRIWSPDHR